jgi:hypothetical protein
VKLCSTYLPGIAVTRRAAEFAFASGARLKHVLALAQVLAVQGGQVKHVIPHCPWQSP